MISTKKKEITAKEIAATGILEPQSLALEQALRSLWQRGSAPEQWKEITKTILQKEWPFALHQLLFEATYSNWDVEREGPPPAWIPENSEISSTHIDQLRREVGVSSYHELHRWSVEHREEFWSKLIAKLSIRFQKHPTRILDCSQGPEFPKWLSGARMNIVESCFQADPNSIAIIAQRENGALWHVSYHELQKLVWQVANGLRQQGLKPGDAVGIDMAMTVEAVAIYLGLILAGCAAVSIADSFAPEEIRSRLSLTAAKAIFTQDYIERAGKNLPMYAKVVEAGAPKAIVIPTGPRLSLSLRNGDLSWEDFLGSEVTFPAASCHPDDTANLLFSSGTTGEPKVIPWSHTTPIKAAADAFLHHDLHPNERICWPTNLGWMMGPWVIFASLINRATLALYYGAPTSRNFGSFIESAKVQVLGLVPSIAKAWRNSDCMKGLDWSALKAFSSTGECSNAEDYLFLMSLAGYKPVIEYCGGTEIGGSFLTGTLVQPASPATFSSPALGLDLEILDEAGKPAPQGEVFLIPPSLGLSQKLLNRDHHKVYFEGCPHGREGKILRRHGDQMERLGHGYFRAQGRADDTMNLGGIKVSSAEIERVLNQVEAVSETAAIAINPPKGGPSLLVIFAVLRGKVKPDKNSLKDTMQKIIREKLNPLFKIEDVVIVDVLPRTASNKVMRRALRSQYMG